MLTQEHAQAAKEFLDEADREFAEGDVLQASEKMWGAASHAIMAVAMQRGQPCGTHRLMVDLAWEIADEQDDILLKGGISAAQGFRANANIGFMEPEEWENDTEIVRQFVARMLVLAG